jgi:uncharacterized membrane protein
MTKPNKPKLSETPAARAILSRIRKYLIAGLLLWAPVLATLWVIKFFVELLDGSLKLLPASIRPEAIFGMHVPGFGVILCLLILFFTGMFVTNFFGRQFVKLWDRLIARIPLIRSIYVGVKQIMETLFQSSNKAFRDVLLVEYPRKGMWSIAFQTGEACVEVNEETGEEMLSIFVPTTPNPTSGFLIFVPAKEIRKLNISVDAALKLVISLGVVQPGMSEEQVEALTEPAEKSIKK